LTNEPPEILSFGSTPFTADIEQFRTKVGTLEAKGGGDDPESSLDALVLGANQPFRPNAIKALVLITDAPPHIPDRDVASTADAHRVLVERNISQLHLVIQNADLPVFESVRGNIEGQFFSLSEVALGRKDFQALMPAVGQQVAEAAIKGLQSSTSYSRRSLGRLAAAIGLWTAILAAGIAIALVGTQNFYLRRPVLDVMPLLKGAGGSLAAGFIAGAAGQLFFFAVPELPEVVGRVVAWAFLGSLLGLGMAFFVPNLKKARGMLGGGIGGAFGAAGYLLASKFFGETPGHFAGAIALGFFIGLMVALIEAVFREAWLEAAFAPNEVMRVTLGPEAVSVGSDARACTVVAVKAAPVAYRYKLVKQTIICEDVAANKTMSVLPGDRRQAGKVVLTVCAAGASPARPASAVPSPKVFSLRLSTGKVILLPEGAKLTVHDLPGIEGQSPGGLIGQVNRHPTDPRILGLKNLSSRNWTAIATNGQRTGVDSGKTVTLVAGTRLDFGRVSGEIHA
jgi:Ca-activated chloride channel family protein